VSGSRHFFVVVNIETGFSIKSEGEQLARTGNVVVARRVLIGDPEGLQLGLGTEEKLMTVIYSLGTNAGRVLVVLPDIRRPELAVDSL